MHEIKTNKYEYKTIKYNTTIWNNYQTLKQLKMIYRRDVYNR